MPPALHPYFDLPGPMILGHRGAAAHAPENTLLSFGLALELGAHAIESDVQVTRDGVPVLIHDSDLDRATSGSGPVAELTFQELNAIDAGHHFSIDDRGEVDPDAPRSFRGQGLRIPSVEEAFAAFPEARFNLEIKTATPGVVARVIALVSEAGRDAITLLAAADDEIRTSIRAERERQKSNVATSASISDTVAVVRSAVSGVAPPADVMAIQIPTAFGGNPLVTDQLISHAREHGIAVHVWTVNEIAEMEMLLDLGVDGLVTDFPGRMAELVEARQSGASA